MCTNRNKHLLPNIQVKFFKFLTQLDYLFRFAFSVKMVEFIGSFVDSIETFLCLTIVTK